MRVRVKPTDYPVHEGKKRSMRRGYAIVSEAGKPMFVGLFISEEKAKEFIKARGWRYVEEAA